MTEAEKDLLSNVSILQPLRPTINAWDFMKLKCPCIAKDTII